MGESFTYDYDLPNDTMYGETCASVDRYIYTERDGGKTVLSHQFIANKAEFASGLTVEQRSGFPWNGPVEYTVSLPALRIARPDSDCVSPVGPWALMR